MEAPLFLLGIDGGGTSCRARLTDRTGRILGEGKAGPANVFYDASGSWRSIVAASEAAFTEAGVDIGEARRTSVCLGLAGLDPGRPRAPDDWPLQRFRSCAVETDAMIALRGAHTGGDGAVLVVGTGSVGLAAIGTLRRSVGGFGTILSDEGSGGWLGREAARRTLWCHDGRLGWSALTREVAAILGPVQATIDWASVASAADFGRLAPIVVDAADAGDEVAITLMRQGATFLNAMVRRLAEFGAAKISVLGGLAPRIVSWIEFGAFEVVPAAGDALSGAILVATANAGDLQSDT